MPIRIDIQRIGGDANVEFEEAPSPLDETLHLANESEKGIELEFLSKKEAEAARFRFYRRVRHMRGRGLTSFDKLVFTIEDNKLLIRPMFEPKVRTL